MYVTHMKVIILCGGLGTRLKEETEYKPKPMVYVGGKPILWHIMKIYAHYGFNEFVLALGYKSDYIKEYFLNQKAFSTDFTLNTKSQTPTYHLNKRKEIDDFKITFVDTGLETMPGERILRCQDYIPKGDKYFMVTYGDGVSNIPLDKAFRFHCAQDTIGTVCGVHPRSKYGMLKLGQRDRVSAFVEKPVLVNEWISGGFMFFKRSFLNYLRIGEPDYEGLRRLMVEKQLSIYKHDGFWYAVDTYKELEDLNSIWSSGNPAWRVWE